VAVFAPRPRVAALGLALAVAAGAPGVSTAGDGTDGTEAGTGTLSATRRPLLLAPGLCEASLVTEASFEIRRRFEPVSLAPDLHCGVLPRLTVGVTHSARSLSLIDSGGGLCLRGQDAGCPHRYDVVALDALTPFTDGDAAVAGRARLVAASFSPFKPSLRLGALIRLRRGRAALVLDPHLVIGLANRDRGNRDQLNLPVRGQVQVTTRVVATLLTGVRGELATLGDAFAVPIGAGVEVSPRPAWDIGLEAGFPRLLGPLNTFRQRHLAFYVTYRQSAPGW
jgi:hypothetical protein